METLGARLVDLETLDTIRFAPWVGVSQAHNYTDGVTEAVNGEGEVFGEDRLHAVIAASLDASADETIGAICDALAAFTGGVEPADDVTVVVVRRA